MERATDPGRLSGLAAPIFQMVRAGLDFVSQRFAGFELHNILTLDLDLLSCLGIAAFAGFAVNIAECAEADQSHPAVSLLQAFRHPVKE